MSKARDFPDEPAGDLPMTQRTFLHVGCGQQRQAHTTAEFAQPHWREIRFDIDPEAAPDIVGTMTDMRAVGDATMDALYSSHNLEHLVAHEVPVALREFRRVLRDDGFAFVACPDLQSICALVAEGKLLDTAYESAAGPIAPIDVLYGFRPSLAAGKHFMAHRYGFTGRTLTDALTAAGFATTAVMQRPQAFELFALATCRPLDGRAMHDLVVRHFPPP